MHTSPRSDGMPAPGATESPDSQAAGWGRRVASMAVIAATGVAIIYVPQPIQTLVSGEFGATGVAASAATIAVQAGYALGIVVLVSLGDRLSARRQVTVQLGVTAVALLGAAASPREKPTDPPRYGTILRTIPAVAAASATLRLLTAVHALCFMAFIALWSMATLYAVDELGASVGQASLLGLAGLVGGVLTILGAPLHARVGAPRSLAVCIGAVVIGTGLIVAAPSILPFAAAGLLLVSAGMSSEQVSTQPIALGGFRAVAALALVAASTAASLAVVAHRRGMLGSRPSRTVAGSANG